MARPSLASINATLTRFNEAQKNTAPSSATDESGNAIGGPMEQRPLLTQAEYDKMSDEELWGLVQSSAAGMVGDYYAGDGSRYRVADDDPLAQQFSSKFGVKSFAPAEMQNQQLTGLIHGKGDIKLYGKDPSEWMQDPSRIMYLDDGSWVIEAGNLKGDVLANLQSQDSNTGLGDNAGLIMASLVLGGGLAGNALGAGALGGGEGALGLDALETYTATTPGWQAEIAGALQPAGAIPEVTVPDLMDPLQPTQIPDIQTPSIDPPNAWDNLGPGDGMSPPDAGNNMFDDWLNNYLSDSGSTTQLPYGAEDYGNLGIIDGAPAVPGAFEGLEAPTWYESLFNTARNAGSTLLNKLPGLTGALKGALPQGGPGGSRAGLGGIGGGGGGFGGGGGSGRGLAADAFEAERLKQIKSLAEYLGGLK